MGQLRGWVRRQGVDLGPVGWRRYGETFFLIEHLTHHRTTGLAPATVR